jgi:hypothetical protein
LEKSERETAAGEFFKPVWSGLVAFALPLLFILPRDSRNRGQGAGLQGSGDRHGSPSHSTLLVLIQIELEQSCAASSSRLPLLPPWLPHSPQPWSGLAGRCQWQQYREVRRGGPRGGRQAGRLAGWQAGRPAGWCTTVGTKTGPAGQLPNTRLSVCW